MGCLLAIFVLGVGKEIAMYTFVALYLIGITLSNLAEKGRRIFIISHFLDHLERDDVKPGTGALSFLIGGIICLAFFPAEYVAIGFLVLGFQDSFSTVVGKAFGKTRLVGKRTLEGFLGGFVASFAISLFFLPLPIAFAVSFIASVVELYAFFDDNILIPIATCLIIYMLTI